MCGHMPDLAGFSDGDAVITVGMLLEPLTNPTYFEMSRFFGCESDRGHSYTSHAGR
jgi:hypothetical protein